MTGPATTPLRLAPTTAAVPATTTQLYRFGRQPRVGATYPFSERQYARRLILRCRVEQARWRRLGHQPDSSASARANPEAAPRP